MDEGFHGGILYIHMPFHSPWKIAKSFKTFQASISFEILCGVCVCVGGVVILVTSIVLKSLCIPVLWQQHLPGDDTRASGISPTNLWFAWRPLCLHHKRKRALHLHQTWTRPWVLWVWGRNYPNNKTFPDSRQWDRVNKILESTWKIQILVLINYMLRKLLFFRFL